MTGRASGIFSRFL